MVSLGHVRFFNKPLEHSIFFILILYGVCCRSECQQNLHSKEEGPLVKTATGTVAGKYIKVFDTEIKAFLGIPFAKPPIGEKRFVKADPIDPWDGTLFATKKTPVCMQHSNMKDDWIPSGLEASEDCLYLNVWSPSKNFETSDNFATFEKLAVMVWIHGGGFFAGSGNMDIYDGGVLASFGEVVVVSVNYRLGIFGFLNGGTSEAPGNAGLFDQLLALKWIKANIQYFGGNPESITLFGESAGSFSTSYHIVSPLSRGLFNRAILQSGAGYHPYMIDNLSGAIGKGNYLASMVGCSTDKSNLENSPSEVIACLKKKDAMELSKAQALMTMNFSSSLMPSLGADCNGCKEFLPEHPIQLFQSGRFPQIPILIGVNKNEATCFLYYMMSHIFQKDSEPKLTLSQARAVIGGLFSKIPGFPADEIYDYYFLNITEDNTHDIVEAISNAFGDFFFSCSSMYQAEIFEEAYFYWFSHRSLKDSNSEWMGVPHFYEVAYIFGKPLTDRQRYTPEDDRVSREIIQKWTSFAKEGYPLNKYSENAWPKFSSPEHLAYELNSRREGSLTFPRQEACQFLRPYIEYLSS